jgi:hypothetical protein
MHGRRIAHERRSWVKKAHSPCLLKDEVAVHKVDRAALPVPILIFRLAIGLDDLENGTGTVFGKNESGEVFRTV